MQIIGHKIIQSINNYSSLDEIQYRSISTILFNSTALQQSGSTTQSQFNQNNAGFRNTLCNSGATNSPKNVTRGVRNLVNGNISGGK